mgnify:CR=1 FL=1|tara:strand:- start:132 stop:848 length:717 start_codon:yes stop_codon:yes gene_type:complete
MIAKTHIQQINTLHSNIEGKLKSTVQDAIKLGELLTNVKQELPHGTFLNWINDNCNFSDRSARNYILLYSYKSKMETISNLPEAYKQIQYLEQEKKRTETQKAFKRVQEFKQTGVKPEGWRKNTDDKLFKEEIDRDKRIEENRKRINKINNEKKSSNNMFDDLLNNVIEKSKKVDSFKNNIRLSFEGKNDSFIDALLDYLETLENDNRRIEVCYNIIKVAKNIAKELHRKLYLDSQNN